MAALAGPLAEVVAGLAAEPGSIGVVCADAAVADVVAVLRDAGLEAEPLTDDGAEAARVAVVPATLAKGLEFDAVVVVDPAAIVAAEPRGLHRLYVVLTRAVSTLVVPPPRRPPGAPRGLSKDLVPLTPRKLAGERSAAEAHPAVEQVAGGGVAASPLTAPPRTVPPEDAGDDPRVAGGDAPGADLVAGSAAHRPGQVAVEDVPARHRQRRLDVQR